MSFVVWKFNQLSLPLEFGSSVLTAGTARLYFHALRIMAALIVAMVVARYWSQRAKTPASSTTVYILAGVARGVSAHFLGDVATAPISPRWPVTKATVPYWRYVLALLVIIAIPWARSRVSAAEERSAATLTIDEGTSIQLDRRKLPKEPKQEVMSCA